MYKKFLTITSILVNIINKLETKAEGPIRLLLDPLRQFQVWQLNTLVFMRAHDLGLHQGIVNLVTGQYVDSTTSKVIFVRWFLVWRTHYYFYKVKSQLKLRVFILTAYVTFLWNRCFDTDVNFCQPINVAKCYRPRKRWCFMAPINEVQREKRHQVMFCRNLNMKI